MRRANPLLLGVVLVASTACHDSEPFRVSPTAPTATPLPLPSPIGTPLHVGESITATIEPSDPSCGTEFGSDPEPCRLFTVSVEASGTLTVVVTSPGPSGLAVRLGPSLQWGYTVRLSAVVQAGTTHEIGVGLHDGRRTVSQAFGLTTSFEPS